MESTANLMIFCGICRKFDKFNGKQQNAMANLETGMELDWIEENPYSTIAKMCRGSFCDNEKM